MRWWASVEPVFRLSGQVTSWEKVMTKTLDRMQSMMTGQLKLTRNRTFVRRNVRAAKAMLVLYERPDLSPDAINLVDHCGLCINARMVAMPTIKRTGRRLQGRVVPTYPVEQRKLGLGSYENLPELAIFDPELTLELPRSPTADTGMDVLVHAVEGHTLTFHNDFRGGLCLIAVELVFDYLRAAYNEADTGGRTLLGAFSFWKSWLVVKVLADCLHWVPAVSRLALARPSLRLRSTISRWRCNPAILYRYGAFISGITTVCLPQPD